MAEKKAIKKTLSEKRTLSLRERVRTFTNSNYTRTTSFIKSRPLTSFVVVLVALLALLLVGKVLQAKPAEQTDQKLAKNVEVYTIGRGPQATFQAKIEKEGVVKIIAQSAGVVQQLSVKEGANVWKGQQLISLSTNYQGGNAQSVQRQIADAQNKNVNDTYGLQNDLINKQRSVATASAEVAQQNRDIARQSLNDTNSLIDTNQAQLDQANQLLATLDPNNPQNADTIKELRAAVPQLQAGLAQLRAQQRTTDYTSANDKAPAQLSTLQKEITLAQLDVQQKGLGLNKEISGLQANLAAITEALMYPATPIAGTVERINVHVGQLINPGTELATIVAPGGKTTATMLVPQAIARTMYIDQPSILTINGQQISVTPTHVATEATDGQLYAVTYEIDEEYARYLTNGAYISISVPIGDEPRIPNDPLIPIDAVYQNQDNAYVLVVRDNKAETRMIKSAYVYGGYVEVINGLKDGDQIILNRNVVAGDAVKIQ